MSNNSWLKRGFGRVSKFKHYEQEPITDKGGSGSVDKNEMDPEIRRVAEERGADTALFGEEDDWLATLRRGRKDGKKQR